MKEQNVTKIAWSEITWEEACALLERHGGYFDGDEKVVVVNEEVDL